MASNSNMNTPVSSQNEHTGIGVPPPLERVQPMFLFNRVLKCHRRYQPKNGNVQFIPIEVKIEHSDGMVLLKIREGDKGFKPVLKATTVQNLTVPVLTTIIKFFWPACMLYTLLIIV